MAKSIGVDLGEDTVKVVEIDGSYRKTRLVRTCVEPMPDPGTGPAAVVDSAVAVAKAAMQQARISGEPRCGYPCREAVLRMVDLPFSGHDAIKKVIKGEVEGEIHSHSVDDMVVDFHVVSNWSEGSRVLVAAVPKSGLRTQLQALDRAGMEPETVDLDAMALYRTAHWCGALEKAGMELEAAGDGAEETAVAVPGEGKYRVAVLDLGARSTRVLLVENGNLVDLRALRLGSQAISEEVARAHGVSLSSAEAAVRDCLATGEDHEAESEADLPLVLDEDDEEEPEAGSGDLPVAAPAAAVVVSVRASTVSEAKHAYLVRLQRELIRFIAGAGENGQVEAVWFTGGGSELTGVAELLAEVFGVEALPLDVLGRVQHELSPEETERYSSRLAVAMGYALGALGGPEGFDFRQEDLAFTRGFDRVKFPLAILSMVAVFAMLVLGVKLNNDLRNVEYELGRTFTGTGKGVSFYGSLNAILPRDGSWFADTRYVDRGQYRKLVDQVAELPVKDRIQYVRNWLRERVTVAQRESGIYEDLNLESGLAVLVRFSEMMQSKEPELGRYLLTKLSLSLPAGRGRRLSFTVAFRDSDFRNKQGVLRQAIDDESRRPDSPFQGFDEDSYREHVFTDADQTGVRGAYYDMSIDLRENFGPFTEVKR